MALGIVTALALFAAISPLIPQGGEKFSELGLLGPGQRVGGYPDSVQAGQRFLLYVFVGNHERAPSYYEVQIKLGNLSTAISNSSSAQVPAMLTHYTILDDNSSTTFPVSLSIPHAGDGQRLIFELWTFNLTDSRFTYTGIWNQLWLNVTEGTS